MDMDRFDIPQESNGCIDTPGFRAAGIHCDVRSKGDGRLDLALVVSDHPCTLAGVFTRNRMAAAPVRLCREVLAGGGSVRAIIANSGNANACTGTRGREDAKRMQAGAAGILGLSANEVLVCSTGRIGEYLPMERILKGLSEAAGSLGTGAASGRRAADAILTSDTRRKVCTRRVQTTGGPVTVSGMAKGAGMIEPNMATMLAFLTTDAAVSAPDLQRLLSASANASFNAITVDGDESTNDTVLLLANGVGGIRLEAGSADWEAFCKAVNEVCLELAWKIVGDGEKITKVVEICIEGAATEEDAHLAARAVANSLLVKSSWYGNDPNWGRLMDALGYSGALLAEETVRLWYAGGDGEEEPVPVFSRGLTFRENKSTWKALVSGPRFRIIADLGSGTCSTRVWSTDLTEQYVNFNKSE